MKNYKKKKFKFPATVTSTTTGKEHVIMGNRKTRVSWTLILEMKAFVVIVTLLSSC